MKTYKEKAEEWLKDRIFGGKFAIAIKNFASWLDEQEEKCDPICQASHTPKPEPEQEEECTTGNCPFAESPSVGWSGTPEFWEMALKRHREHQTK